VSTYITIHARRKELLLEWYPWELFSAIEEIEKGGYGAIFRAKPKLELIIGIMKIISGVDIIYIKLH
jgi:hypothetical protein